MNQSSSMIDFLAYNLSLTPPMSVFLLLKLGNHNYMIWKDKLLTFVNACGLEGTIYGSLSPFSFSWKFCKLQIPCFLIGTSWIQLWRVIYGSVSRTMLRHLISGTNAKEHEMALEESYTTNVQSMVMELCKHL